jgi:hypothetical protein
MHHASHAIGNMPALMSHTTFPCVAGLCGIQQGIHEDHTEVSCQDNTRNNAHEKGQHKVACDVCSFDKGYFSPA